MVVCNTGSYLRDCYLAVYLGMKKTQSIIQGAAILLLFCSFQLRAQETVVTDSISNAFLPALSYNSDFGFMGGGLVQRYHYKKDQPPFFSFLTIAGILTTKGLASGFIELDKPNAFGTDIRLRASVYGARFYNDPFFGIGSYQKIPNSTSTSDDLYFFQSFSTGFDIRARYPIHVSNTGKRFDLMGILTFDYETPWHNEADRLIMQQAPLGVNGGRTLYLGTGFVWESRNSEFRPTSGRYAESTLQTSQEWLGSSYQSVTIDGEIRNYVSFFLLKEITLANRFYFRHTSGDVPYWKLAYAGDEQSLRGYPARRFLDDNVMFLNTELRTWLFKIKAIKAEFGGTLFFDVGRTFPNGESLQTITDDLKYSFGIGGTSSFFTPDFILRTDVGFSDEGVGVYFTAGYMF